LETTSDDTLGCGPLRVFFFGGPDGVAARASEALNRQHNPSMVCVGFESPGFGSVEQMSSDACIARINATGADFVVVALGARKGQAWIEHNRKRLTAPVISHLGAVVNFVAGTVVRAPAWVQKAGLEWAWRIKEEPALWRRYASDGLQFGHLLITRVLPGAVLQLRQQPNHQQLAEACVALDLSGQPGEQQTLKFTGAWTRNNIDALRPLLAQAAQTCRGVHLDVEAMTHMDSAVMAQLSLLWAHCVGKCRPWTVSVAPTAVRQAVHFHCADYLLLSMHTSETASSPTPVAC
jgi:N-acetylglucosaminyldiphosphoundecaprenol N-acetyl-beta-D-mannosaminyltransferase